MLVNYFKLIMIYKLLQEALGSGFLFKNAGLIASEYESNFLGGNDIYTSYMTEYSNKMTNLLLYSMKLTDQEFRF